LTDSANNSEKNLNNSRSAAKYRASLKIHFVSQANLFGSGHRQTKTALSSDKADLSSLPEPKIFYLLLKSNY